MNIKSNVYINENKWKEFLHVFFKDNEDNVYINVENKEDKIYINIHNNLKNLEFSNLKLLENQEEIEMKTALLKLYDIEVPWGSLVGVRPSKLVRKLLKSFDYKEIEYILSKIYMVSKEKIDLLLNVVKNSINYLEKESIGIYIGLAFCPTKCTYCSFPAYLKKGKYLQRYDEYFSCILREIEEVGILCKQENYKINTIYVGGGTPSFLNLEELETMLSTIKNNYNLENILEYTFEAGRIDTLDYEKLKLLKEYGVTRISINPQSFKDETLKLVNRYHNIDKLNEVYTIAKEMNFEINMDFIIGLPKENTEDILNTIEKVKEYDVDNITFHYLAMKNASYLTKSKYFSEDSIDYRKINDKIHMVMNEKGYIPYYMYRQKNSSEDGENVGYCKEGKQLIYNIEMIEENKSIIAIGAGAITKIIKEDSIKRLINPKDPLMWVNEFEERLSEKLEAIRGINEKKEEKNI